MTHRRTRSMDPKKISAHVDDLIALRESDPAAARQAFVELLLDIARAQASPKIVANLDRYVETVPAGV